MIFVHNHPSGEPTASPEDRQLTDRLVCADDLLGIPILDHIVVGAQTYTRFADAGRIMIPGVAGSSPVVRPPQTLGSR